MKKKEKIKKLETKNKTLIAVIIVLVALVVIALGALVTKSLMKKFMTKYEDIDYLIVDTKGTLTGFSEYNLTKKVKVEYKDTVRTEETYSAGDKLISLIEHEEKEEVVIPSTIKRIEEGVFYGNNTIKTLKLEMKLNKIADNMFSSTSIERIILPASVSEIGTNAFNGSVKLKEVILSSDSKLEKIGNGAFSGCSSLKTIDLKGIKEIGKQAFYGCNSIKKIYLSKKLEKVGDEAFKYLANQSEIILENMNLRKLVVGKYTLNKTSIKLDSKAFQ